MSWKPLSERAYSSDGVDQLSDLREGWKRRSVQYQSHKVKVMTDGLTYSPSDTLLHDALTLLYTAPERYGGVSGVVRNWTDAGIWGEAQAAWRAAERSRGSLIAPIGRRGGSQPSGIVAETVRFSVAKPHPRAFSRHLLKMDATTAVGAPAPGSGALHIDEMLQPMSLLSDAVFSLADNGIATVAGRRAIAITARPRRQWHSHTDPRFWEGPDEYRLLVDAARGILLGVTGYFRGRAMAGAEMQSVRFHDPLLQRSGRWQRVGEVVNLLYGAQRNFATARAAISVWGYGGNGGYRLWAANPDCFREEYPESDDDRYTITAFRGPTRWRYSPRRRQAQTNAAVESLPDNVSAELYLEPLDPGLAVYEIRDGEYAIIAEWALNPSPLLYALWLEPLGRTVCAGRDAIRVRGEPNPASGYRFWHENAETFELLVDAERGTLLRMAVIEDGAEVFVREVTEIEFDAPISDEMFGFDPPPGTEVQVALPSA